MPGGGIIPARTLRITFSQTSACDSMPVMLARSSDRPAVFVRALWHDTQYLSTTAR